MTTTISRTVNPYVGPRPFTAAESDRFFGRSAEVAALRSLLYANRVVVLHAPSGAGKTSMVRAGLFPELERDGDFDILPIARVAGVNFAVRVANPFSANTVASWDVLDMETAGSLAAAIQSQPRRTTADGLAQMHLAVFDQFEELFTWYPESWQQRRSFMIEMREALQADKQLRILLVIRDDYLGQLDPLLGELAALSRANLRLDLLRRDAALTAVESPLAATGVAFGEGVASSLVDELMGINIQRGSETVQLPGEFVEPVQLQVVCEALWANLPTDITMITTEHWQQFGDVDHALTDFYRDSIKIVADRATLPESAIQAWVEHTLITEAGTRSTAFRGEAETSGMSNEVLDQLEDLHVIRGEERLGGRWYELTHDRLVAAVSRAGAIAAAERAELVAARNRRITRRVVFGAGALAILSVVAAVTVSMLSGDSTEEQLAETATRLDSAQSDLAEAQTNLESTANDLAETQDQLGSTAQDLTEALTTDTARFADDVTAIGAEVDVLASGEELAAADRLEFAERLDSDLDALLAEGRSIRDRLASSTDLSGSPSMLSFDRQLAILLGLEETHAEIHLGLQAGASIDDLTELSTVARDLTQESYDLAPLAVTEGTTIPPNQTPTSLPTTSGPAFSLAPGDHVIRFGTDAPDFFLGDGAGSFLRGTEEIVVGPDNFDTFVEVATEDAGLISLTITTPAQPFEVWALVNAGGSAGANSMRLLIDRVYQVQNVAAGDTLNVRDQPGLEGTPLPGEELAPNGSVTVCTNVERSPVVETVDGDDWYQVLLSTATTTGCQDGVTPGPGEAGWVNASFIAWETWDMFEADEYPPASWAWDQVSTRCQQGDTHQLNSCILGAIDEPRDLEPGEHTLTLRGRGSGTRVAALVVRPTA